MNKSWLQVPIAAVAGALVALFLSGNRVDGQQTPALIRGGGSAGVEKEPTLRFTTTTGGKARADYDRNVFKIPNYYGEPFAVTTTKKRGQVVWYRSRRDGSVRNVIVDDDRMLVRIAPND